MLFKKYNHLNRTIKLGINIMLIYTDLKDKEGTKIYSNSVLFMNEKESTMETGIGPVYFSKGSFMWNGHLLSSISRKITISGSVDSISDYESWFSDVEHFKIDKTGKGARIDDCTRIVEAIKDMGQSITSEQARGLWIKHSEDLLSGWVYLPKREEDLKRLLKKIIKENNTANNKDD